MYKVYAYPHILDVVAAVNAVADSVGDPSVSEAAAQAIAHASRASRVELLGRFQQQHHLVCTTAHASHGNSIQTRLLCILQSVWVP